METDRPITWVRAGPFTYKGLKLKMARDMQMTHRCARCGHGTPAGSLTELLFEPPTECPNCGGTIKVQAYVGKPIEEVEGSDGPEATGV